MIMVGVVILSRALTSTKY